MFKLTQTQFYWIQIGLLGLIVALYLIFRPGRSESGFKVREADRKRAAGTGNKDDLANAKIERPKPLQLPGIRLDGRPNQILGVPENATEQQIKLAYRELMKRYHPDLVGPQNSREWRDAQRIAHAITEARDALLNKKSNN